VAVAVLAAEVVGRSRSFALAGWAGANAVERSHRLPVDGGNGGECGRKVAEIAVNCANAGCRPDVDRLEP